jgi:O-antigen biosynthesis protein
LTGSLYWRFQRFQYLFRRVTGSIAQRGLRGTLSRIAQELQPPVVVKQQWQFEPLEGGSSAFSLPSSNTPLVSVVIPVYGKLEYTLACLRSIALHGASAAFEVIVVDDASPDSSVETLKHITGLRLLCNAKNLGFIGSCNAGAQAAQGSYLLLLNNDTQVTSGWLDNLLNCFQEVENCGIAGSRLVYPDGRLQEAGGIIFSNGDGWNYGRFDSPDNAKFLYCRDVDYVSGASLMIEKELFDRLGGLDTRYTPAYYEDTDIAFATRAAGKRVVYQPTSVVIHFEGISSGTDLSAGVKQYQRINKTKFTEKWSEALTKQPSPDIPADLAIHNARQPHILILDALTPDPSRDSGSLRMVNIMRLLRELGWRVTFMADNRLSTNAEILELGQIGVQTLCKPWAPALATWLKSEASSLNAVMLCRHYVASPNIDLVRRIAPKAKIIFDTVDLHFLREQRAAEHSANKAMAKQANASQRRELALIRASDVTLVVSPVELKLLSQLLPDARVELLSNVHTLYERRANFAERKDLVFVGGFNHPPNADAVKWLCHDIFPRVRAERSDIALHLIGDIPDSERGALQQPGVHIHGRVHDLFPWMNGCRIALAPLRYGAGVKGKVNMAMSYGLPVVATPMAAEGMYLVDGENILLAEDASAFASAVLRLYEDQALWMRISDNGQDNIRQHFSFSAARKALERVLSNAA